MAHIETKRRIGILGSTGSIGTQSLEVVSAFPDVFDVVAMSCGRNLDLFKEQVILYRPEVVSVMTESQRDELSDYLKQHQFSCDILVGKEGLLGIARMPLSLLVVAIVGTAALCPTATAIDTGTPIALACKEVLVAAGDIIMAKALEKKVPILPIDSEHAALKQCLAGIDERVSDIDRLILTASGGPFRDRALSTFDQIELEDALKHPNWDMGAKITIDSATMMNKGLEVIEAHHLYQVPFSQIDVLIHPTSIVHSLVEFCDGTFLAQMGTADMRYPIQYAMTYPEKVSGPWPRLKLSEFSKLEFFTPDIEKFPLLNMAYEAGEKGGSYPVVLNAANEAAVKLFLDRKIRFLQISGVVRDALDRFDHQSMLSFDEIVDIDERVKSETGARHG